MSNEEIAHFEEQVLERAQSTPFLKNISKLEHSSLLHMQETEQADRRQSGLFAELDTQVLENISTAIPGVLMMEHLIRRSYRLKHFVLGFIVPAECSQISLQATNCRGYTERHSIQYKLSHSETLLLIIIPRDEQHTLKYHIDSNKTGKVNIHLRSHH